MNKPEPAPVDPNEVPSLALQVVSGDRFPVLATIDNDQPRLRPVSPVRTSGFTVWIANLKQYRKTLEIAANPQVELCYVNDNHDQVRLTGRAFVETDSELLQEIWESNPLLQHYLGSADNPNLIVYRVEPTQVRYMREWALQYHDVPC